MSFWTRLGITVVAMIAVSFLLDMAWNGLTGLRIPTYIAGVLGGLVALPVWELLRARAKTTSELH